MLIKDIPYKKVRELAEKYAKEIPCDKHPAWRTEELEYSFYWEDTEEGWLFWRAVEDEYWEGAEHLRPELFIEY